MNFGPDIKKLSRNPIKNPETNPRVAFALSPPAEKAALILFYTACLHTAFVQPFFEVIPGERSKVLTGIVCLVVFASTLMIRGWRKRFSNLELTICATLVFLIIISGILSSTPGPSLWRGFVISAPALGAFFAARVLIINEAGRKFLVWFCCGLFIPLAILSVIGHFQARNIALYMESDLHPLASRYLLLMFAPITLILTRKKMNVAIGVSLLSLIYFVFYLSSLRSAMLIPVGLAIFFLIFGAVRLKWLVVIAIPLALILFFFFRSLPPQKIGLKYEPAYYRAESYPFALHIIQAHPWFGIGLRAPRDCYLEGYDIKYPYVTKEKFAASLKQTVTSENIYINFIVDLGIPFSMLYFLSIGYITVILFRKARDPSDNCIIPHVAILASLSAGLLHFTVLDGLLHPQVSWYFHLLLGLIPVRDRVESGSENSHC